MRENLVCRRCASQSRSFASGRKAFAVGDARPHYAPDLPFRTEHILLDVEVNPTAKTLKGKTLQTFKVLSPHQTLMKLNQIGLNIETVQINGKSAPWSILGNHLFVTLSSSPKVGDKLELQVAYQIHNPQRGMYFTGPDSFYPKKRHQVWSQGQDEDSQYWFPCLDYPNQKATSEVIATVPKGFTAVSNGALLSQADAGDKTKFHYKLGTPHVTYLICLTVAEFSAWEDKGPHGLPVQYFVEPGREADGRRTFGRTPLMIEAFEAKTGVQYPYEKYSQVAVQDFIFGGMENTSATTQTDLALFDARADLDFDMDHLVAHELAHQWFGDLITCRDWSHGWLNEGFATFMERVWIENRKDRNGGFEEAQYYSYSDLKEYLDEDQNAYRRPIVCNTYSEPIDLFDRHLYNKGGLVLNLIRNTLGEDLFWKSINAYVQKHRGQSVETLDLIRAIEDTTGRNLRRLFDEWIFNAGYPELELTFTWHEEKKLAEVVIEQKQTQGKPSVSDKGSTTYLFHLPATIDFVMEGKKISHTVELGEARDRIFLSLPSKPLMVRFDPKGVIPKTMKFPRPKEMLIYQLTHDEDCTGKIEAAQELVKIADASVVEALGEALLKEKFWGTQAEIAEALGKIRMDQARDALIAGLKLQNPKARQAVVKALGQFKDQKSAQALEPFAKSDPSYFVESTAITSVMSARTKPAPQYSTEELDALESFAMDQLKKDSYREIIRSAAIRALSELPGINRGERPRALAEIIRWTDRGKSQEARTAAVTALGKIGQIAVPSERARILQTLNHLADEPNFRLRMALVHSLGTMEGSDAANVLGKIKEIDPDGRVKRSALVTAQALHEDASTPESVSQLRSSLEKLEEEYRKLKSLVEETKAKT